MNFLIYLFYYQIILNSSVGCQWNASAYATKNTSFILSLTLDNQEIENTYINNKKIYSNIITYLNYGIEKDIYLHLPNRQDSVAAIAASYPRQYGNTGHSSVLIVFPVSDNNLTKGCYISFDGRKLSLGTKRFVFTAHDILNARKVQRTTH